VKPMPSPLHLVSPAAPVEVRRRRVFGSASGFLKLRSQPAVLTGSRQSQEVREVKNTKPTALFEN